MRDRLQVIALLRQQLKTAPVLAKPAIAEHIIGQVEALLAEIVNEIEHLKGKIA